MNRNSYRMLAFVLVFAMMLGVGTSMMPASVQASGHGHHPPMMHGHSHHMNMDTGSAYFKPNSLPQEVERDFHDKCPWWKYELRGSHYVRVYCPCRYGDAEVDYSPSARHLWAQYVSSSQD